MPERVVSNDELGVLVGVTPAWISYGLRNSASMLISADEWRRGTVWPPGALLVFAAFGTGFRWGAPIARCR